MHVLALLLLARANESNTLATDLRGGTAQLLSTSEVNGSMQVNGCASGLSRLVDMLEARRPLRFLAVGSSVTGAHGGCTHGLNPSCPNMCGGECYTRARKGHGWLRKLVDLLEHVHPLPPGVHHEAYNGGKGATHLEHYTRCLGQYMPRAGPVDVVIVEITIFSACGAGAMVLESFLRALLLAKDPPAVLLVRSLFTLVRDRCDATIFALARANQLPVFELHGSSRALLHDAIHPNAQGQVALAALLGLGLAQVVEKCRSPDRPPEHVAFIGQSSSGRAAPIIRQCFGFMSANASAEASAAVGKVFVGSSLLPPANVLALGGWRFVTYSAGSKAQKVKPGLVATSPGSTAIVAFQHDDASDAPFAAIEYLTSYEHMGIAQVRCQGGCMCPAETIDAHDASRKTSEHASRMLRLSQVTVADALCELNVTVLGATSSGEHKFKLTGLVVGGSPHADGKHVRMIRAVRRRLRQRPAAFRLVSSRHSDLNFLNHLSLSPAPPTQVRVED